MHQWGKWENDKIPTDIIYLDISKAFDTVVHSKLLVKMEAYGIAGNLLSWFRDYLNGRLQRIRVGTSHSDWSKALSGVPQGSVLGPLLFLIYINDLSETAVNVSRQLFADDLKLFNHVDTSNGTRELQVALDKVFQWTNENQLDLAAEKCKILHVGTKNRQTEYYINDRRLEPVNQMRDLGVIITDDLRFRAHCEYIARKASLRASSIFRGFECHNTEFLMRMFDTFVLPVLEYASVIWNPAAKIEIDLIERIQRRFTKRLPGMMDLNYEERLVQLNRPTLQTRRNRQDLVFLWSLLHGQMMCCTENMISMANERRQTMRGHNMKILMPMCRTNLYKELFPNRTIRIWNSLHAETVNTKSVNAFKRAILEIDI